MNNGTFAQTDRVMVVGNSVADISRVGRYATPWALVLVFGSTGEMKFTAYKAGAIEGLIARLVAEFVAAG